MITFTRHDGLDRLGPAHRYYAYCIADLAMTMPVSGVFCDESVLTEQEIYDLAGVPGKYRQTLLRSLFIAGWIGRIRGVYYVKDLERFTQKPSLRLALKKVKVLTDQFSLEDLNAVGIEMAETGSLENKVSELYLRFNFQEREVVRMYLKSFMTKAQIEKNQSIDTMSIEKRIRLLEELVDMYSTGTLKYGGKRYVFDKPRFIENVRMVADRKMTDMRNHNYLKKVLMNGRARKFKKNVEGF